MANERIGTPVVVVNNDPVPVTVVSSDDLDTQGNRVPTYKAHAYTYDGSGNMATDTVSDGSSTWVRSFTYTPSGVATDSGWVKQ